MTAPDLATARRLSVAPMMDWTDRYCRSFHRLLTRQALLYSEMVTTGAILKGARERFLAFDPSEQPLALQLGGSDPGALAESAARGAEWGYSEINLNCGCPSDRVQDGRFGACLMAEPELVRDGVKAMIAAVPPGVPVTVKCRIGIDREESYEVFERFVLTVAESGCNTFIVHARKAWLDGLSPKENREIPPLRYDVVARLKERNPALTIVLNGGIQTLEEAKAHRMVFDGVMLGRAAYQNPWLLASVDREIFGKDFSPTREEVVQGLVALGEKLRAEGLPIRLLARHALGLMNGLPGARSWRRLLSEATLDPKASPVLFQEAAAQVRPRELAA